MAATAATGEEPTIFVVDDDRGLARLIEKSLRREGLRTAAAHNAADAVAWLDSHEPDLMLLDLKLDNVEARDVIDQLTGHGRLVPFIIITGQGDERVAVDMMKRGALDYLVKDAHFHDLVPTIVRRGLDQVARDRRLAAAEQERKQLQQQIIEISEGERRRIGQDLHDGLGQHLTGIELMTEALEQKLAARNKTEAARAGDIARHVRDAVRQTRALARGLSPVELDTNGLMAALKQLAETASDMFAIRCRFHCPAPVLAPNNAAATHLFRIAQEAVSNAVKHGHAHEVEIRLASSGQTIVLTIADDGSGIVEGPRTGGMGLRIMQYRAEVMGGSLAIEPRADGRGMIVSCRVARTTLEAMK